MNAASSSSASGDDQPSAAGGLMGDPRFQIFEWYPAYQSCQRYFLDHAQYEGQIHAFAALVNIRLPCQWSINPVLNSHQVVAAPTGPGGYPPQWQPASLNSQSVGAGRGNGPGSNGPSVSLVPYIRRLVVTGMDKDAILHGFFGNDWQKGVGPFQECERRNYLFCAKGIGMTRTKAQYDMNPHETVPFMKPLANVKESEITQAEKVWGDWLTYVSFIMLTCSCANNKVSRLILQQYGRLDARREGTRPHGILEGRECERKELKFNGAGLGVGGNLLFAFSLEGPAELGLNIRIR
jgi:hypothetical protein